MQQQLIGKMEKFVAPIVEELDTSVATLRVNEENNDRIERNSTATDSSTAHGATDQEWSTSRKKHSSKKGIQSEIVLETQGTNFPRNQSETAGFYRFGGKYGHRLFYI
ncbi:hypothetical protein AMTRI_Chr08g206470 [Amborella trichopoda]